MKIPQTPPPVLDQLGELHQEPEQFVAIFDLSQKLAADETYLHWDELRWRPCPPGITHEQWWLALKIHRTGLHTRVPLRDVKGGPFKVGMPTCVQKSLREIDMQAAGRIEVPEKVIHAESRDRYILRSLRAESITSSQIEGASTTRRVAQEMLRSGRGPRTQDERMILNNFRAMERIRELQAESLSAEMVFEIQSILTDGILTESDGRGRFRRPSENVDVADPYGTVLHRPPDSDDLPGRMEAMVAFANGEPSTPWLHPAIRPIVLHFWLAYDHPFTDGNGRTARALFYWAMLRAGYWLTEFLSISDIIKRAPVKYGRAFLYTETDENDLTYFLIYHLQIISEAIEELYQHVQSKAQQVRRVENLLRDSAGLNHRQVALLSHALRHSDGEYTIESHRRSHGVVYQTARADLCDLEQRGLLRVRKARKRYVYQPMADLEDRLRTLGS